MLQLVTYLQELTDDRGGLRPQNLADWTTAGQALQQVPVLGCSRASAIGRLLDERQEGCATAVSAKLGQQHIIASSIKPLPCRHHTVWV